MRNVLIIIWNIRLNWLNEMEFINKETLLTIIEKKLGELNSERQIIREQRISTEEKLPDFHAISRQEAIWMQMRSEILTIPTYKVENMLIVRGN